MFFWLREGVNQGQAEHIGFVANSTAGVDAAYSIAISAGASDNGAPAAWLHYDPHYFAANVADSDGYSLEFVYKSWQHVREAQS